MDERVRGRVDGFFPSSTLPFFLSESVQRTAERHVSVRHHEHRMSIVARDPHDEHLGGEAGDARAAQS